MPKRSNTKEIVYSFICNNPGMSTYEISKRLNMSGGKVRHALYKLEKDGLVKFKSDKRNPRFKKLSYPVDTWKLLPSKIKFELKKFFVRRRNR